MTGSVAIARPYAQALFDLAREDENFGQWSDMLGILDEIASNPDMQIILENPESDRGMTLGIFIDLGAEHINDQGRNLLRLLMEHRRCGLLPGIAKQFEGLRADYERRSTAEIISARPLSQAQKDNLREGLEKKLGHSVKLECTLDETLIGGAMIRLGDMIIDGSARGKLEQLSQNLI